ncbi:hypothetical protein M3686_04765 [Micrococcus luteus]|uniref:hypothetical protein n=1 Tax=Micrococcus luteus TaxID=1270 RepID=UPI00203BC5A8|nr:hypothetical protein [Micrococcus luteus]MCM3577446.1 hypothetical protein [Micrococcus luteus]
MRSWLQLRTAEPVIEQLIPVVAARIDALPSAPRTEAGDWDARTVQAAIMLTARLYRRRNSPAGVEAFTEGGATYVSRWDPDVAQLLRIGSYAPPRVG